jgi:hypothetical protein
VDATSDVTGSNAHFAKFWSKVDGARPRFVRRLKELISLIGLDPNAFSGHSFGRGAATLVFSLTGNHELIMGLGDWRSNAYLGYRQISDQSRCVLPRLMAASATDTVSRAT